MNGTDTLVLVDIDGLGDFVVVGSQRNMSVDESNAVIDESSKDARERKVSAGRYEATMSFDALFVPNTSFFQALKDALRNGTSIKIRIQEAGTAVEEVTAIITSMTREFPDQEEATISLEAAIDGAFTVLS